ncbi:hypothetical protein BC831DRAFT_462963 [Entophlyctis helioformis]|nr:hypothetical protein BC831DRAFT_462963 [Entophlyctis helioformis]
MTSNHELALQLTRFGQFGPLKLSFAIAQVAVLLVCAPIIIAHRDHPVIKFRSWSVNITMVVLLCISSFAISIPSFDYAVPYNHARMWYMAQSIASCCILPGFIATYLRHYFLLHLPVVQAQLLDHQTMVDPDKYKSLSMQLTRIRLLSSERGAWLFYLPHAAIVASLAIWLSLATDIDAAFLGKQNLLDTGKSGIYVLEVLIATVGLFYYLPKAPKDNLYIKHQLYTLQLLTDATVLQAAAALVFKGDAAVLTNQILTASISLCLTIVDLVVPVLLLYFGHSYEINLTKSKSQAGAGWSVSSKGEADGSTASNGSINSLSSPALSTKSGVLMNPDPKTPKLGGGSGGGGNLTIPRILDDETLKAAFAKYLAREFSMESLLFIEAVRHYRSLLQKNAKFTAKDVSDMCAKIVQEFMEPNSINEVNLPKIVTDKTLREIEAVSEGISELHAARHLFDHAADHIANMLAVNHIRKFQASQIYKEAFPA